MRKLSLTQHPTTDRAIAHFVAPCPTCAHLLIERFYALKQSALDALRTHYDAHGDRASDPAMQAHEARRATPETAIDPQEFCPVYPTGPLDTPLPIPERARAVITHAMCHAARVRGFLNSLGVTYAS
jgi:hypothetical protein